MLQRLLHRLFLPSVLVVTTSFMLTLLTAFDRTAALLYSAFVVFHLYLTPALLLLLAALALLVALQEHRWIWALVLTAAATLVLALPFLFDLMPGDQRAPVAVQLPDWPFSWYATVDYSLLYGALFVALFVIWPVLLGAQEAPDDEERHA